MRALIVQVLVRKEIKDQMTAVEAKSMAPMACQKIIVLAWSENFPFEVAQKILPSNLFGTGQLALRTSATFSSGLLNA